jgi:hypothetical protein
VGSHSYECRLEAYAGVDCVNCARVLLLCKQDESWLVELIRNMEVLLRSMFANTKQMLIKLPQYKPLRTEVYFWHQNQNAKNIGNITTLFMELLLY